MQSLYSLTNKLLLRLTEDGGIQTENQERVKSNGDYRLQDKRPWFYGEPPSSLGFKRQLVIPWYFCFTIISNRVSNPGPMFDFHGL